MEIQASSNFRGIVTENYLGDGNVQFMVALNGPNQLIAGLYDSGWYWTNAGISLPTNTWVHTAATYDRHRVRIYQDGTKVAESGDFNRAMPVGSNGWRVGARWDFTDSSTVWKGKLDDVGVYSRALSDAEIASHAAVGAVIRFGDALGDACDPCPTDPNASCVPATCTDTDGDGFGPQGASACAGGAANFDCNDISAAVHPGATELCNGVDDDCDGVVDENCVTAPIASEFGYDSRDRMVSVTAPGGSATYGYGTDNLRVRINDSGGDRRILLDGIEEMAEYEAAAGGDRAARYDHDPSRVDGLLAQVAGPKTQALTDALGSVYGLVDASGASQARYSYDAYGTRSASIEATPTQWGFTGRRHDAVPGSTYYRLRFYSDEIGRWLSDDPLGMPNGPHRYLYVSAQPTAMRDPSGLLVELYCRYADVPLA